MWLIKNANVTTDRPVHSARYLSIPSTLIYVDISALSIRGFVYLVLSKVKIDTGLASAILDTLARNALFSRAKIIAIIMDNASIMICVAVLWDLRENFVIPTADVTDMAAVCKPATRPPLLVPLPVCVM